MKNFSSIKPANLRCEYKINPLGIEELNPRLSWAFQSSKENERGQKQTAYQIIVARKEENLENKKEDLWNSGKIFSDKTFQIDYKGKKLFSRQECCWQVRVWDKDGKVSQWSNLAFWKMGLLKKSDWKADWIYFDKWQLEKTAAKNYYFKKKKDKWIWNPGKKQIGNFYFRKSFTIKNLNEIKSAKLLITADEKYTLYINEKEIDKSDDRIFSWARPKLIDITPFLLEGKNAIAVEGINSYLTKPGLTVKLFLNFNDSQKIIRTNATWKSTKGKNNNWYQINFDDSEWKNSKEIILMGDKPWRIPNYELILPPPVYLRENFLIKKRVKKAYVFISALGLYHLTINGKGVTDDRLTPGWTDYNKRVHYFTYDVTKFINNSSSNTAGIILADGWYSGYVGWERRRSYYGTIPKVIFQIEIEYEDGTIETISTDKSWKANYGQIKEADLLMGEIYDAKKDNEMSGWDTFSFNDSAWEKVKVLKKQNVTLNSFAGNPIRKTEEILPINFSSPSKRIYIFDLGQNFAGCVRLKINGKNSAKIVLRFGEVLNDDGTLYVENIRMARATDTYYPKGLDEEIWEPKFTYHGFRYVELSGYNDLPNKDTIAGIVFHSDMIRAGSFVCSNKLLNKIYENIIWSQRSNFMDLPTDCPQRDERLGWTADAVDFIKTAAFNFDISSFYTKWITDLNDAQEKNGAYTAIAPKPDLGVGPLFSGAAGFADSGIISPFVLYKFYDDKKILEKYFENMEQYVEYLKYNSENFIRPNYGYGDWLAINADTPNELIGTAFFAHVSELMSEISKVLGKKNHQKKYIGLSEKIKKAFNKKFVLKNGEILSGTQTSYLLALSFNLLSKEKQKKAFNFLIKDIIKRDYHFSTGFIGLQFLLPILSKFGRDDIAYRLLLDIRFPSWGFMIQNGATTMWERWESYSPQKGIYDPLMNSFNHTSLGVIGEWIYSHNGGINLEKEGFKKINIKPKIGGGLTFARTSYNSIGGKIISNWKIENQNFFLEIEIPINTKAKVFIPSNNLKNIFENNEPISKSKIIKYAGKEKRFFIFEVQSGRYRFSSIIPS